MRICDLFALNSKRAVMTWLLSKVKVKTPVTALKKELLAS